MKQRTENNGSNVDDWETPHYILEWVKEKYGDYFDPCPLGGANSDFDGLKEDWGDINYINPPYSRGLKDDFIRKAYTESQKGKICILLIPSNTDTKIFHEVIAPNSYIYFIKSRIKFKGYNTKGEYVTGKAGQTGSMICIMKKNTITGMTTLDFSKQSDNTTKTTD